MKNAVRIFLMAALLTGAAMGQDPQAPAAKPAEPPNVDKPAGEAYARLSFVEGKAFLQRAADLGFEEVAANMPVAPGDRLATTEGRAEVNVARRMYVRLDHDTKVDFVVLPKTDDPLVRLRQWAGSLYLDVAKIGKEKGLEVLTEDATFYFLDAGVARIDVRENGRTEILVFEGLVEASGEEGSILVKKNQRLAVSGGRFDGRPASFFAAADDAFDRWNEDRQSIVHRPYAERRLPEELEDYESELDASGDWQLSEEFGWVWVPRGLDPDWRPYSWGRWLWLPSGWCWLPYEPWGWATFHYGYWHWGFGLGWHWIPYHVWSPAWVSWWWDPWYYGWAPMSWWGYPGIYVNNRYYGRGWNGDYPYNSRALTVVRKDQLQSPDIRKAALNPEAIRSVGKLSLKSASPTARPEARPGVKVENLGGGRQVILRKDARGSAASPSGTRPEASGRVVRDSAGRAGSPGPAPTGGGSAERRIRSVGGASGYPSSSHISRARVPEGGRNLRSPSSSSGRTTRLAPSRGSSSRPASGRSISSSSSRSSSGGSSSRVSSSRGSSSRSSGPSRSGSSSRSGGSSGRSAGSGGSIRKK